MVADLLFRIVSVFQILIVIKNSVTMRFSLFHVAVLETFSASNTLMGVVIQNGIMRFIYSYVPYLIVETTESYRCNRQKCTHRKSLCIFSPTNKSDVFRKLNGNTDRKGDKIAVSNSICLRYVSCVGFQSANMRFLRCNFIYGSYCGPFFSLVPSHLET